MSTATNTGTISVLAHLYRASFQLTEAEDLCPAESPEREAILKAIAGVEEAEALIEKMCA